MHHFIRACSLSSHECVCVSGIHGILSLCWCKTASILSRRSLPRGNRDTMADQWHCLVGKSFPRHQCEAGPGYYLPEQRGPGSMRAVHPASTVKNTVDCTAAPSCLLGLCLGTAGFCICVVSTTTRLYFGLRAIRKWAGFSRPTGE